MFLTLIPIHMKIGEKELRGRSGVCAISGVCATTLFVTTKRFQQQYHCFDMGTYESAWKNVCHHMIVHDSS